jgi:hypothetical protein
MKLTNYIATHYSSSVRKFAVANDYHVTQVQRHIDKGAYIEDGKVYFKKYLNKKGFSNHNN